MLLPAEPDDPWLPGGGWRGDMSIATVIRPTAGSLRRVREPRAGSSFRTRCGRA